MTVELAEMTTEDVVFSIYNAAGKLVKMETVEAINRQINLHGFLDFASGMYLVFYELKGHKYKFKAYKK